MADWRDEKLDEIRKLVKDAFPAIEEKMMWKMPSKPDGVHTWYHEGLIGHGQIFKGKVKISFAKGGQLDDPKGVFNTQLGGKSRAIDLYEGDKLNKTAFKKLVRDAAKLNES